MIERKDIRTESETEISDNNRAGSNSKDRKRTNRYKNRTFIIEIKNRQIRTA